MFYDKGINVIHTIPQNNSRSMLDQNVKDETIMLLEEKKLKNLFLTFRKIPWFYRKTGPFVMTTPQKGAPCGEQIARQQGSAGQGETRRRPLATEVVEWRDERGPGRRHGGWKRRGQNSRRFLSYSASHLSRWTRQEHAAPTCEGVLSEGIFWY